MDEPKAGESSTSPRSSVDRPLDLPSLQPLSHDHPLLSGPTFSADTFLLSRLHIPLEELRGELRSYLATLREELVQLINDDYEEFIALGTGLRGENDRLRRLQVPLKTLADDVGGVKDILSRHQEQVQAKLDERASLREEKSLLDLLQRLFETLKRAENLFDNGDGRKSVQRIAGEYSQLVYLCDKAAGCQAVDSISPRISSIRKRLSEELSQSLLQALGYASQLRDVLKTYEFIEGWTEAEEVIRERFKSFCRGLAVPLKDTIPDLAPKTPATPLTNPFELLPESSPIASFFNQILREVELYKPLMSTSDELSDQFDFFARVLWPEIATIIIDKLGNIIFAAGRPDELHKHYTLTHDFISLLESYAPSSKSVLAMRASPEFANFEKRWQLPVYFQLRWKEIVSAFESSLSNPPPPVDWALGQSAAAWKALSTCWDEDVYISELANRFWRLSLQITNRYESWLREQITSNEDPTTEEAALRIASSAIVDLERFGKEVREIEQIRANDLQDHLSIPTQIFSDKIVEIITARCADTLKLVRSVASQLRAAPAKTTEVSPSYFISSILKPLHALYTSRPVLKSHSDEWSPRVVDAVCSSYAGILAGVRKTEDLLRRHRKSKKGGFSIFGGSQADEGAGEEERFKKQMEVDLEALKIDAKSLGVDVEGLAGWKELVEVVQRPAE